MSLRSRPTERRLRSQALQRIAHSPRLRIEYRRARRAERWTRFWKAVVVVILLAVGVWMLIGYPVMLAYATRRGGLDLALVLVSVVATALSYFLGCGLVTQLRRARELAIFSCLPLHDQEIARLQRRSAFRIGLLALLASTSFYVSAALVHRLAPLEALVTGLCGVTVWGVTMALVLLLTAAIPRWLDASLTLRTGGALICMGIVASIVALRQGIPIPWREIADGTFLVLPAGWVNSVLYRGVIQHQPDAWWLLIPVAITLLLVPPAVMGMNRAYRVREISFSEVALAQAVFENPRHWEPVSLWSRQSLKAQRRVTAEADEENPLLDRATARSRVLSGDFLQGFDWKHSGWIERAVGAVMDERERAVTELLQGKAPPWTRNLLLAVSIVATLGALALILPKPLLGVLLMGLISAPVSLLFGGTCPAARWRSGSGMASLAMINVPAGYREVARAVLVIGSIRGLFLLPVAAAGGALVFSIFGGAPDAGAVIGAKVVLVCIAMHYWAFATFAGIATDKRSILRQIAEAIPYIVLGLVFAAAAIFFVIAPLGETWSTPAAAVMFGCGWAALRLHERFYSGTAYDIVGPVQPKKNVF